MKHRLLAGILCLTLLLGMLPAGVGAADTPEETVTYAWEDLELSEIPTSLADDPEAPEQEPAASEEVPEDPQTPQDPEPEPQPEPQPQPQPEPQPVVTPEVQPPVTPEEEIPQDPEDPEEAPLTLIDVSEAAALYSGVSFYDKAYPRSVAGETIRPGIDVSSWQGTIDWAHVAEAGIEFAIIRVAYRGTGYGSLAADSYYYRNITEAQKYGIKVGAYIFSQAITVEEGVEEARFSMKLLEDAGLKLDLPLVIDYEFAGRLNANDGLSRQERTDICNAFCKEVERNGYASMVYANKSMLTNYLSASQLSRVWLAHYIEETNYTGDYEYWQFSSSGAVWGISTEVDLDFWFDNGSFFLDVHTGDWFQDAVDWAFERGIMSGIGGNLFAPNGDAQRAQVVSVLYRALAPEGAGGSMPFLDVPLNTYYTVAVAWAYQNAYVTGVTETSFEPLTPIKRQDLTRILYEISGEPEYENELTGYSDLNEVSGYAKAPMAWAVEQKIITGFPDGTLHPKDNLTRAQLCTIIRNYLNLIEREEDEDSEEEEDVDPDQEEDSDTEEDADQGIDEDTGDDA